jgi:hypothetical protein
LVINGKDEIGSQQSREPVACKRVADYCWCGSFGVAVDGCCQFGEGKNMHEDVDLEKSPGGERNVAHKVIEESQPVDASVTAYQRCPEAQKHYCENLSPFEVDFKAIERNIPPFELILDVAVEGFYQSKLAIDSQQHHGQEENKDHEIGHRQQKQRFGKHIKAKFQS